MNDFSCAAVRRAVAHKEIQMRLIDHTDKLHSLIDQYSAYYMQKHSEEGCIAYPIDCRDDDEWMDDFMAWLEFTGNY